MGSATPLDNTREPVQERDFNDTFLVDVPLLPAALLVTTLDEVGGVLAEVTSSESRSPRAGATRGRAEDFINWRDRQRS